MGIRVAILLSGLSLIGCQVGNELAEDSMSSKPEDSMVLSVNDLMIEVIAPATDTLWQIDDPKTVEEWQVFIDAADTVIKAGKELKEGGAGVNDERWAGDPGWQVLSERLIEAGFAARTAAVAQDIEAVFTAGNELLYPPCEECHKQFHPGIKE